MSQDKTGLEIQGLTKTFRKSEGQVLAELNLSVNEGEFVTLIGSSGAGKTTLLRIIAGLEKAGRGRISYRGKPLTRGQVGYVFQQPVLYPHLNVRENILFATGLKNYRQELDQAHYRLLLDILELGDLEKRKPAELSGGQAQRVGIARALVRKVPLVLFDEPLSSVDEELSSSIRADIQKLHRELNFTALYITHNQDEALQLGQKVAVMSGGSIVQCAPAEKILADPASLEVAQLTGYPALNTYRLDSGQVLAARATAFATGTSQNPSRLRVDGRRPLLLGTLYSGELIEPARWTMLDGREVTIAAGEPLSWFEPNNSAIQTGKQVRVGISPADIFSFPQF